MIDIENILLKLIKNGQKYIQKNGYLLHWIHHNKRHWLL